MYLEKLCLTLIVVLAVMVLPLSHAEWVNSWDMNNMITYDREHSENDTKMEQKKHHGIYDDRKRAMTCPTDKSVTLNHSIENGYVKGFCAYAENVLVIKTYHVGANATLTVDIPDTVLPIITNSNSQDYTLHAYSKLGSTDNVYSRVINILPDMQTFEFDLPINTDKIKIVFGDMAMYKHPKPGYEHTYDRSEYVMTGDYDEYYCLPELTTPALMIRNGDIMGFCSYGDNPIFVEQSNFIRSDVLTAYIPYATLPEVTSTRSQDFFALLGNISAPWVLADIAIEQTPEYQTFSFIMPTTNEELYLTLSYQDEAGQYMVVVPLFKSVWH